MNDSRSEPGNVSPASPEHLIITVHGIRTFGDWQGNFQSALAEGAPGCHFYTYKAGYFSCLAFLVPFMRWAVAKRFRLEFLKTIEGVPLGTRIDVVAHSFGTYLVAKALPYIPRERSIHTIIFAGSVLKPSFPWYRYVGQGGCVRRVVNECGVRDSILVLNQLVALGTGMAGRVGFNGNQSDQFRNRYYNFGHGGYFENQEGERVRASWVSLLTTETPPALIDCRAEEKLTIWKGFLTFLLNNAEVFKIGVVLAMAIALFTVPMTAIREKHALDRVKHYAFVTRLSNAAHIPQRDPAHVRELLQRDLDGLPLTISAEGAVTLSSPDVTGEDEAGSQPGWWGWFPGMADRQAQVYEAMNLHAKANAELAVEQVGKETDKDQAQALFVQAIRAYGPVKDLARNSYALCLLDHGRVLTDLNETDKAIKVLDRLLEEVYPKPAEPSTPGLLARLWSTSPESPARNLTIPRSLNVDALRAQNEAYKKAKKWNEAQRVLNQARTTAEFPTPDSGLLAEVENDLAWLCMERLQIEKARDHFRTAQKECEAAVAGGSFTFKTLLYHIRHGRSLAQRLFGNHEEALRRYNVLVRDIESVLSGDDKFLPKQRRDLRTRLVNSMERRADCKFFTFYWQKDPKRGVRDPDEKRAHPLQAYRLLSEAYKHVGADDPDTQLRLLYKKYIAHFLARPMASEPYATDAFLEAERIYASLSPQRRQQFDIYRKFATSCFDFRGEVRPGSPKDQIDLGDDMKPYDGGAEQEVTAAQLITSARLQLDKVKSNQKKIELLESRKQAIESLRELVQKMSQESDKLMREHIEMLLLASEILVDRGVLALLDPVALGVDDESDAKWAQRQHDELEDGLKKDANLITELVGATTRGSVHPELGDYVARFNDAAASARQSKYEAPTAFVPPPAPEAPDERLVFFLKFFPGYSLSVHRVPDSLPVGVGGELLAGPGVSRPYRFKIGTPLNRRTTHSVARPVLTDRTRSISPGPDDARSDENSDAGRE
ncbi:MAG: hypothetical protein NVSMB9_19200 [Isosphaeraceae bacterium]